MTFHYLALLHKLHDRHSINKINREVVLNYHRFIIPIKVSLKIIKGINNSINWKQMSGVQSSAADDSGLLPFGDCGYSL